MGVPPPGLTVEKMRLTASAERMLLNVLLSGVLRKWISMPSLSWAVQIGAMDEMAAAVSRHFAPDMLPLSSIRKTVSKWLRKANWLSVPAAVEAFVGAEYAGGASLLLAMIEGCSTVFGRRVGAAGCLGPMGSYERGTLSVTGDVGEAGDVGESDLNVPAREDLRLKSCLMVLLRNMLMS